MPAVEIVGQREALADAGEYRVLMKLKPFAAKHLGVDPREPLVFRFETADEALDFHALARSRTTALTAPWGAGKHVTLQPSAWGTVTLQTPRQIIVTPGAIEIRS